MKRASLEDAEEPVIELVRECPLKEEREKKIAELLKKLDGLAKISVIEVKLGDWIYDSLERMLIEGVIEVK